VRQSFETCLYGRSDPISGDDFKTVLKKLVELGTIKGLMVDVVSAALSARTIVAKLLIILRVAIISS
jgi:hypothetical protein